MNQLNGFQVFTEIESRILRAIPSSIIRLGDGEGAIMGFPDITNRPQVDRSLSIWFGTKSFSEETIVDLAIRLRSAVRNADLLGLPREKQVSLHPLYKAVLESIDYYKLQSPTQLIADAALHRYMQFALFFRRLLMNKEFVGIITPRTQLTQTLKDNFNIKKIDAYSIKGESKHSGDEQTPHFPDRFFELERNLTVPFKGALFLVGAGALGKIYCDWIKQRGGIALDIGAIFDAWAQVKSRLVHPCHSFQQYIDNPEITMQQAIVRYNQLCDHFELDTPRIEPADYQNILHEKW